MFVFSDIEVHAPAAVRMVTRREMSCQELYVGFPLLATPGSCLWFSQGRCVVAAELLPGVESN